MCIYGTLKQKKFGKYLLKQKQDYLLVQFLAVTQAETIELLPVGQFVGLCPRVSLQVRFIKKTHQKALLINILKRDTARPEVLVCMATNIIKILLKTKFRR